MMSGEDCVIWQTAIDKTTRRADLPTGSRWLVPLETFLMRRVMMLVTAEQRM